MFSSPRKWVTIMGTIWEHLGGHHFFGVAVPTIFLSWRQHETEGTGGQESEGKQCDEGKR